MADKPKDPVKDTMSAAAPSSHASAIHDAQSAILKRYADRVGDDRAVIVDLGKMTAGLIDLNLSIAKDETDAKLHRAQTTKWLADRVADQFGDSVSPDEWVAVYQLTELARPLTASVDSARISARFLRVARSWVSRSLTSAETGYREVWTVRDGFTEHLRSLFDHQAKTPRDTKSLRDWMTAREFDAEQLRIDAIEDGKAKAKAQAKLDAKRTAATPAPTSDLPSLDAIASWTAADAASIAEAIITAGNVNAAAALARTLGPWIVSTIAGQPAAPAAPTLNVVPPVASQVRQVA
jgi:hypothetical protein